MSFFKTADLVDAHDAEVKFCQAPLRLFGRKRGFYGRIRTVKTFEDNLLVRRMLEHPGSGCVLVVDGGGSMRTALVGDGLASLAEHNGWSGIVVNGVIRDTAEIRNREVGIFALGTSPRRSKKEGTGEVDVTVSFGGVELVPGHVLYADEDGVLVAARMLQAD